MRAILAAWILTAGMAPVLAEAPPRKAENVLVVTLDGFRWQDLFSGADETLMEAKAGGVRNLPGLKKRYWRETAQARREVLMPFFWGTVAQKGQVFGNPARKATARSTNGLKFSYPGYSELFCGFPDPRIDSNGKRDNPNLSVLEFLNGRSAFKGKVEAVCTWDVFPYIFRSRKNGLPVLGGWEPFKADKLTERERQLNELLEMMPRYWPDNCFDVFTMGAARSVLERRKPRVLYIALGETDEWGHGRRYDLYLDAAHKADRFLAETWAALQKDPHYKDRTALLITTDHGRGSTRTDWTDHGKKVPGAEYVWAAVMGPGTPALGERENVEVTQSQVAATVAALVGEDFNAASPASARPFPLAGTPAPTVTAKGWAVFDGKSGALLWSRNADEPLKAASTTKIMCANVVLSLAALDPKVLDERVTFSKLADDTSGSTADVKAGESLTVRDCLYGLLLPSGNDAGNALAEHFNARLAAPTADLVKMAGLDLATLATRANFVAEMNRTAAKLGLRSTVYRIPYGDGGDAKARTTTPRELGVVAWQAMKDALFRKVVSTANYECEVKTPEGGTRKAAWKNTNRLLGKNGYDGVKTGTTTQAGTCLVSSGRRGKDHLIIVVLGSKSDEDRYTDTEALFRWSWELRASTR